MLIQLLIIIIISILVGASGFPSQLKLVIQIVLAVAALFIVVQRFFPQLLT